MLEKPGGSLVVLASTSLVAVALTSAAAFTPSAGGVQEHSYGPIQAMTYVLGSKRAVGYFSRESESCNLTLMVAEEIDPEVAVPMSAARLRVSLMPGQSVQLDSDERLFLDLTCGPQAETVVVRTGEVASETL